MSNHPFLKYPFISRGLSGHFHLPPYHRCGESLSDNNVLISSCTKSEKLFLQLLFPLNLLSFNITKGLTVIIIFLQSCRCFRIGCIVLALHDTSDVFLEAAKVFKYSERELGASVCFGFFALSWVLLRLIFFPFWIIKTSRFLHSSFFLCQEIHFPFAILR